AVRRYVCYAPGTGLPRRLQICEILQCEHFAVRGGPARNDELFNRCLLNIHSYKLVRPYK
ncbi:MAG: hypothetical protein LBM98_10030, partial [Oscillospiraceae bacterium]|nr:hypothetical protein [Oscillospiraceae bacterium]